MNSEIKFFTNLDELAVTLNSLSKLPHNQLLTTFISARLRQAVEAYQETLSTSEDYLSKIPAQKVFREIQYQQKKRFKELQDQFDPEKIKKRLREEAKGAYENHEESDSRY